MEDEMILKQPTDRRLTGDIKGLPPGPPGAENDEEFENAMKEGRSVFKDISKSRRRSPSGSPPSSKRKTPSRGPRSPRGRRTPSPRRRFGRSRNNYSPDRRRFNDRGRMRSSPLRNRSRDRMDHRRNGRDRFRLRCDSRSLSRSSSPITRRRWSPKKKPSSPPIPPPAAQYSIVGSGMYSDAYAAYGQYGPPQQSYGPAEFVGASSQTSFTTGYPPPPAWGVPPESYQQPNWVSQSEPMPPAIMQQPPLVVVQQSVPVQPPGTQPPSPAIGVVKKKSEVNTTHDAVAQEAENQRDELKKQRTSYLKKTSALKKELKVLKDQRKDLIGGTGSHSPTTKGFLDENERLQSQIQKKLSTIENVIDMLTGIIGEENLAKEDTIKSPKKHSKKKRSSSSSDDSSSSDSSSSSSSSSSSESEDNSSPERLKNKAIESMKHKKDGHGKMPKDKKIKEEPKKFDEKKINYVFYDPEMHWCKICDSFPKTAKDYLTHLHSKDHADKVETMETPWHNTMTTDEYASFEGAPVKRTPIRGLTFFVPATAWYCKICSIWMGDLHCASLHLKSKTHSNNYNAFMDKNPHYEVNWLAERQKQLIEKKSVAPPATQITTNDEEVKEMKPKLKNVEDKEKISKKRKKKTSEKKDKKKKKRSKKRKKIASSSSSYDSSSETEVKTARQKHPESQSISETAAPSIRVLMRNIQKENEELEIQGLAPPPPPKISEPLHPVIVEAENSKKDDLISQWNTVQSVISESEKKLFEQLKGKLKNRPAEIEKKKEEKNVQQPIVQFIKANEKKSSNEYKDRVRSPAKREDERNDIGKDNGGVSIHRRGSRSRPSRRSRSGSAVRSRRIRRSHSRGAGLRRSRSRGRKSSSRSRFSPRGYGRRTSRSQARKRSRSHGRTRRRNSSSRSRSRSGSNHRIEKAIVRQPEFRPRVPVIDANNVKKNKAKSGEEREDRKKSSSKSSTSSKKLPFIGRMPVFKKQSQNSENFESEKKEGEENNQPVEYNSVMEPVSLLQDTYVHAGYEPSLMSEYEDLMPDPVQFVSLMGAPPPPPLQPPPQLGEEENDILPPGIDETESEFVPKPISDAPIPRKGPLPKDFEEALNIIFPGETKHDDDSSVSKLIGETQIITDEPLMQQSDLLKEGIHMMTVEETSLVGIDEASQMSMNEPLRFNKPASSVAITSLISGEKPAEKSPPTIEKPIAVCISAIPPPPPPPIVILNADIAENTSLKLNSVKEKCSEPPNLPSSSKNIKTKDSEKNLEVIGQALSPTDSEKHRRQEELDDLAMLGIDADDMAAMCI